MVPPLPHAAATPSPSSSPPSHHMTVPLLHPDAHDSGPPPSPGPPPAPPSTPETPRRLRILIQSDSLAVPHSQSPGSPRDRQSDRPQRVTPLADVFRQDSPPPPPHSKALPLDADSPPSHRSDAAHPHRGRSDSDGKKAATSRRSASSSEEHEAGGNGKEDANGAKDGSVADSPCVDVCACLCCCWLCSSTEPDEEDGCSCCLGSFTGCLSSALWVCFT